MLAAEPSKRPTAVEIRNQFNATAASPSRLFTSDSNDCNGLTSNVSGINDADIPLQPHERRHSHPRRISIPRTPPPMVLNHGILGSPGQHNHEIPGHGAPRSPEILQAQKEPLIDPRYLRVNSTNTRIATVTKKGNFLVQQLWDAETGQSLWKDKRLFDETFACYPSFAPQEPYVGFYDGSGITILDTNSLTLPLPVRPQPSVPEGPRSSSIPVSYPIRAFAIGPRKTIAVAPKTVTKKIKREGIFDIIRIKTVYPKLNYTPSGTDVFACFAESEGHVSKLYLVITCFDISGLKDKEPLRMESERFIDKYQVHGVIHFDQEECVVVDVTYSKSDRIRKTATHALKTSTQYSRAWIAVSSSGVQTNIKSFERNCNEEIVVSEGKILIVDLKGNVREWQSELMSLDHGWFDRLSLPKGKVVAVRKTEETGSATLLSDEGIFHFAEIRPEGQRGQSMTGTSMRSGTHECEICKTLTFR
jgi:phosphoribosyl-AMP cyclohydrolase